MALETKILSLTVEGNSAIAKVYSTNRNSYFEYMLDGWTKWKRSDSNVINFVDLNEGNRTLLVRSFNKQGIADSTPAQRDFVIEKAPDPDPPPYDPHQGMGLYRSLDTVSDWDSNVTAAPGATVTNVVKDGQQAIRFYKPNGGERNELQVYDERLNPHSEALYEWEVFVPNNIVLDDDDFTICQQHGNNQAGYTGGIKISTEPNGEEACVSVKGGKRLSASGSQRYEYELNGKGDGAVQGPDRFGQIKRDTWHKVSYHCLWRTDWTGFVRCQLDNGPVLEVKDVPTASEVADVQMFRLGWYSSGYPKPLDMYVRKASIWLPV